MKLIIVATGQCKNTFWLYHAHCTICTCTVPQGVRRSTRPRWLSPPAARVHCVQVLGTGPESKSINYTIKWIKPHYLIITAKMMAAYSSPFISELEFQNYVWVWGRVKWFSTFFDFWKLSHLWFLLIRYIFRNSIKKNQRFRPRARGKVFIFKKSQGP